MDEKFKSREPVGTTTHPQGRVEDKRVFREETPSLMLEPFVSADEAAQFLCVKRRFLLELARRGIAGAYSLGTGNKRKIWVFRLSELAASLARNETPILNPTKPCTIGSGSPR
jgi:hypothetical protein